MAEIADRLTQCFTTVFPSVPKERIPSVTQDSLSDWDSVAHITLLTVIDEEFGISTDLEEAHELSSYSAVLDYVQRSAG